MARRGVKRVHVLPAVGQMKVLAREQFWAILSASALPDLTDVDQQRISRVDSSLLLATELGKDQYVGELLDDGWVECQKCDSSRHCDQWDGIGRRMRNVPIGIVREGGRFDGDEDMLWKLGLAGPEELRKVVNSSTSIFNVAMGLFSAIMGGDAVQIPQYPQHVVSAARLLGLSLPTSREAIDAAYKAAAFRFHPDNKEHGSEECFKAIVAAKEILLSTL